MPGDDDRWLSFNAFLSHRYKSPRVNLYFFDLFSGVGEVQFRIDEGDRRISMTRLQRMIRDADAFIGIYPYPVAEDTQPGVTELRAASRYFRLELDLAVRARKPAIVFCDRRYRSVLRIPPGVIYQHYDPQEVASAGGNPTAARQLRAVRSFCDTVRASKAYQDLVPDAARETIGIMLPPTAGGYPGDCVEALEEAIAQHGHQVLRFGWPPVLDLDFLTKLRALDWAVVDVAGAASSGLLAFLQGAFVPMLLLKRAAGPGAGTFPESPVEQALFGAFENVGYVEDLLFWHDLDSLLEGVTSSLSVIDAPSKLVSTAAEATAYFRKAGQRKEHVFLSYAGEDVEQARTAGAALRERFGTVFDYQDGRSIPTGAEWQPEILDRLTTSAVGVLLLSDAYLRSSYCLEEAQQMNIQRLASRMHVFPVRLDGAEPPHFLRTIQYRDARQRSFAELVQEIDARLGPPT
jgi:TIR domain